MHNAGTRRARLCPEPVRGNGGQMYKARRKKQGQIEKGKGKRGKVGGDGGMCRPGLRLRLVRIHAPPPLELELAR